MIEGSEDRAKIVNNFRTSALFVQHQLKDSILHQSMMSGNKLIINDQELIDMEPVEEISPFSFILMSNGVAWDINNLVNYIMHTTYGNNLFDKKTKHVELIGKPIWSDDDMAYLRVLSNSSKDLGSKIKKLLEYIHSKEYLNVFTLRDREEIRRFASIFGALGAWWEYELEKVCPKELYEEWQKKKLNQASSSMPTISDDLHKICVILKGKYLLLYKDYLQEMTVAQKKALVWLNSTLTENYQKEVVQGRSCIMAFSSRLTSIVNKFDLSIKEMDKSNVKEYIIGRLEEKTDTVEKEELLIQMFPSKVEGNKDYET
jgi:hypothetical protein